MSDLENNHLSSNSDLVAFVGCSGKAAQGQRKDLYQSCSQAVVNGFRRDECKNGCVGIGSCIESCPKGALKFENNRIIVDREKCDGCGECAKHSVCPQHLIKMIPRNATNFIPCSSTEEDEEVVRKTCGFGCIACGECERACPVGAVSIQNNHAVIDYSKCVGCSACALKCKKKIIVDTLHDISELKDKVAFVKCSGGNRALEVFQSLDIKDCHEAQKIDPREHNLCTSSCCGLGCCTKVCRYNAISIVNGTAYVNPDKCVGCKDCVNECPKKLITIVAYKGVKQVPCSSKEDYYDKSKVCDSGCTGCKDCIENCPNNAIYLEDKHACIDAEICENCNVCQYVCGRNVIKEMKVRPFVDAQRIAITRVDSDQQGE